MSTMTHTTEQKILWHQGKRTKRRGASSAVRQIMKGNYSGAYTPSQLKRGLYYRPLKKGERV